MSKLEWDNVGERLYETGVQKVTLYPQAANGTYPKGYAWNGVTAINLQPSGAEANKLYADNIKYLTMMSVEELGATIEAYMSPVEFDACDGSADLIDGVTIGQQDRSAFGLVYRSEIGNDILGDKYGYKLHVLYGCKAQPSERQSQTINESPEASTMSWELDTTPVPVAGKKPTSYLVLNSVVLGEDKMAAIEAVLFGTDPDPDDPESTGTDARLPLPSEIVSIINAVVEEDDEDEDGEGNGDENGAGGDGNIT